MGYIRAEEILPIEIIELIQQYIDGENVYIPRKPCHRKEWGTETATRQELLARNKNIYQNYLEGMKTSRLAEKFFLSEKSIQRIVREMREIA